MRKRGSIDRAVIDPKTFAVELYDSADQRINKNKLSAGEKQIYAVAMLDALARTSGNHLPIIIDTPLGRLDSQHRNRLVNKYFPSASHQVILLSTDTEIDLHHYSDLERHCVKKLHITFDWIADARVRTGYFFSDGERTYHDSLEFDLTQRLFVADISKVARSTPNIRELRCYPFAKSGLCWLRLPISQDKNLTHRHCSVNTKEFTNCCSKNTVRTIPMSERWR